MMTPRVAIFDTISHLASFGVEVTLVDPYASAADVQKQYNYPLSSEPTGKYDVIVLATKHKQYTDLSEEYFRSLSSEPFVLFDIKGMYRKKFKNCVYFSL